MKHVFYFLSFIFCIHFCLAQEGNQRLMLKKQSFKSDSGKKIEAYVGKLKVLENRNKENSEEIDIHFIQLKSTNPNPKAPVIYLAGGPGGSSTWQAKDPYSLENWLPYLALGDVILLDQRGTGRGTERVLYIWKNDIPQDVLVSEEKAKEYFDEVNRNALIDFARRKVDLEGYTTIENAKDIDELRKALKYDKVSLLGFSYGTHLGQAYIKYFKKQIENAVLIGVEGSDHTFKLPSTMDTQFYKIAMLSNQDQNVNIEVPDLVELYKRVVRKIEKEPITLEVISPLTNSPMKVDIGPFGLNLILRLDIGDRSDLPVFPRLLYTIDQGDYSILKWFVQKRIRLLFGVQGMSVTMDKASGASANRLQRIAEEKKKSIFKNIVNVSLDSNWPAPDLGSEFRSPLISNTRTLFMSGTLDFNTPPHQAEEVRWGFSNSSHIIIDNAGHEQILTHPEAGSAIIRFLKGENVDDVALSYPKLKFIPVVGDTGKLSHPSMQKKK
ncbi:alpha/beta hydrolase [Aquimarina sp. AU474]|uniref:alpha/beta hydrolase n=1 Tax=Aquimarina sp. AU474 TaxID=2108529 RepID=UPI000D69B870|nr:alpha/beta hydrolase [Aquimarina sp. AU474]